MEVGKSIESLSGNFSKLLVAANPGKAQNGEPSKSSSAEKKEGSKSDPRPKLTDVSSTLAAVEGAKNEIDSLVKSLGGIVELAVNDTSPEKIEKLTQEGNELVEAIRTIALSVKSGESAPLAGDPIKVELESTLGKRLELLFPDDAARSFGIGSVNLSKKEFIIELQANIEQAKRSLEKIGESVKASKEKLKEAFDTIEVALQNSESSSASLRDVDEAAELVKETAQSIFENGDRALQAISSNLGSYHIVTKEG